VVWFWVERSNVKVRVIVRVNSNNQDISQLFREALVAIWLSGNTLALINVVALRRARLVLWWVTVRGYTILVFNQACPSLHG